MADTFDGLDVDDTSDGFWRDTSEITEDEQGRV